MTRSRPALLAALAPALVLALPLAAQAQDTTVSHGLSPFGDLKYPADFPYFDYVNPDAPQGGTMTFRGTLASNTFDSLNMFILKGESAQGLERLHDSLMVQSWDEPASYYPLVAESVEYPEDRSWATFTMRPEARFSDGEPIEASDVVFSLEMFKTQAEPYYRILFEDIESAEALDAHTVKFTFADGAATRDLPAMAAEMPILAEHYYADVPFDESTLDPPVSSGRFRVDSVSPGRTITYCKDPDYWGEGLPVIVGKDNFDCYTYEYFADRTAQFEAFKAGEYLLQEEFTSSIWATSYDFPAIDNGWVKMETIPDGRSSGAQGFYMNLRRPVFQDVRVREAIGMMFNFEWTNQTLFYGLYERSDSFWENSDLQAEGLPEGDELAVLEPFRDQLPDTVFTDPAASPPVYSGERQLERSANRAASALLDDAGWTVGADGIRTNAEGDPLRVEFISDSASFERIILPFIENMKRVGIDAVYTRVDSAQEVERQQNFDFDIMIARIVLPLRPSVELRTIFGSRGAEQPGTLNLAGVSDPVVDALIEEIIGADDLPSMTARVKALDRVLRAKHIWVPNWYKGTHWMAYWDVFGKPDTKPEYDRGTDYWWWDQEKYEALQAAGALR